MRSCREGSQAMLCKMLDTWVGRLLIKVLALLTLSRERDEPISDFKYPSE